MLWIVILVVGLMAFLVVAPCCALSGRIAEMEERAEPCEHCGSADDVTCEECAATRSRGRV
jgi:hypothetical protein